MREKCTSRSGRLEHATGPDWRCSNGYRRALAPDYDTDRTRIHGDCFRRDLERSRATVRWNRHYLPFNMEIKMGYVKEYYLILVFCGQVG